MSGWGQERMDRECLRTNGYEHASRELDAIEVMVGGWLKAVPAR
jgi:hypothetical protein